MRFAAISIRQKYYRLTAIPGGEPRKKNSARKR
jgi:hypothetical protein